MGFPNFKPTKVDLIELSDFGSLVIEDQEGIEKRVNPFTQGRNAKLSARFEGLNESQVLEFIVFYKNLYNSGRGFGIPESFKLNQSLFYENLVKSLGQVVLYFERKPSIVTEVSGVYTVTLYMVASIAELIAPDKVYVTLQSQITISAISSTPFVQWTQISGNPVSFSEPNNVVTTVTSQGGVFSTTGGRIILKVSLLDNLDVFALTEIVPAPTSFDVLKGLSCFSFYTDFPSIQKVLPPLFTDFPYSLNPSFDKSLNVSLVNFKWNPPSKSSGLVYYRIETYDEQWINLGITSQTKFSTDPKQNFRIISCYQIGNNYFEIPSELFFIDPTIHLNNLAYCPSLFANLSVDSLFSETFLNLFNSFKRVESEVDTDWSIISSFAEENLPLSTNYVLVIVIPLDGDFSNKSRFSSFNAQLNVESVLSRVIDLDLGGVVIG